MQGIITIKEVLNRDSDTLERWQGPLYEYVQADRIFKRMYELYTPESEILHSLKAKLPKAKVITISAYWCPDCRRNVPRMARIAEHLPDWEFKVRNHDKNSGPGELGILKIPAFIVLDSAGKEIGRIIENPKFRNLEEDLLRIVERNYDT